MNSNGGATLGATTINGTATVSGALFVGTTNVLNAINNISLTPGPTGATGAQGIQGIQGLTGATGPAGAQGIQGLVGANGTTGTAGAQGIQGLTGATGATGPAGAEGIQGLTGATGATGPAPNTSIFAPLANPVFTGTTTCSGTSGNISSALIRYQQHGFCSMYFDTINSSSVPIEKAQIFAGQNGGLQVCTNTAHSIKLSANREVAPMTPSIEISGTGNKSVTINSPFIYKPWVSFEMRMSGTTATIGTTSGFNTATAANCVRTSVGTYSITLPLHPNGNSFIPNIIARTSAEAGGYYYLTIIYKSDNNN